MERAITGIRNLQLAIQQLDGDVQVRLVVLIDLIFKRAPANDAGTFVDHIGRVAFEHRQYGQFFIHDPGQGIDGRFLPSVEASRSSRSRSG